MSAIIARDFHLNIRILQPMQGSNVKIKLKTNNNRIVSTPNKQNVFSVPQKSAQIIQIFEKR